MSEKAKKVIGIDLGTTYSGVACINEFGVEEVIPNDDNQLVTPSVILFAEDGEVYVGEYACENALAYPDRTVQFVKRRMDQPGWKYEIDERAFGAPELSAIILRKLVQDAEKYLNCEINDAIVTVPAYFTDMQRKATKDAGAIAGLNVIRVLDEPVAAALSFGVNRLEDDCRVMVFDLGGGTLDITIMEMFNLEGGGREIKLITTQGNSRLGGKDWDDILVKYVAGVFIDEHGEDPLDDLQTYQEIYNKCVAAKESLSRMPKTTVIVNYKGNFTKVEITRGQFETMSYHLVDECRDLAKRAMSDKGIEWDDMDQILLVGGSTYMPMIRTMLTELSGGTPLNDEVNPSLAVALGAAIATTTVQTEDGKPAVEGALPPVKVDYIISHSVGIVYVDTSDGDEDKVKTMLPKDARIPAEFTHTFGTLHDKTTAVNLRIMQGEGDVPEMCEEIGTGKLTGIPPRPAGEPIEVIFALDENQILLVTAKHAESGRAVTVKVERPGLTDDAKKLAKEMVGDLTIFTS